MGNADPYFAFLCSPIVFYNPSSGWQGLDVQLYSRLKVLLGLIRRFSGLSRTIGLLKPVPNWYETKKNPEKENNTLL